MFSVGLVLFKKSLYLFNITNLALNVKMKHLLFAIVMISLFSCNKSERYNTETEKKVQKEDEFNAYLNQLGVTDLHYSSLPTDLSNETTVQKQRKSTSKDETLRFRLKNRYNCYVYPSVKNQEYTLYVKDINGQLIRKERIEFFDYDGIGDDNFKIVIHNSEDDSFYVKRVRDGRIELRRGHFDCMSSKYNDFTSDFIGKVAFASHMPMILSLMYAVCIFD